MLNKMKIYFNKPIIKPSSYFIFFLSLVSISSVLLNAQESYLRDIQIENSTKSSQQSSDLPSNPFELVEMIRRANSMNDATKPSDAIDDALKSFDMIEEREKL